MNEIFVKDYDYNKFIKKFVDFEKIVCEMKAKIKNDFSFYLVDLIIKNHKIGEKTCTDVRYHLDGNFELDNQYCIYCEGSNRTIFCNEKINFENFPKDRESQNRLLEEFLKSKDSYEIPEKEYIVYDSKTPHKGVVCKEKGKRVFIRLMGTNYIKPKNYIKL
jgi:hypothetical protein